MIYVVLAMGNSGTTLIAESLHTSGIDMGQHSSDVGYDEGNFYERQECLRLNQRILGVRTGRVIPRPSTLESDAWNKSIASLIEAQNRKHSDWGFKDPRTTLLYPLWAAQLPTHKIIAVYRPIESHWSRFRHPGKRRVFNPHRAFRLAQLWCHYNRLILKYLADPNSNGILLSYPELMRKPDEFKRLERFVGRPLADRRDSDLHRNRARWSLPLKLGTLAFSITSETRLREVARQLERRLQHERAAESVRSN